MSNDRVDDARMREALAALRAFLDEAFRVNWGITGTTFDDGTVEFRIKFDQSSTLYMAREPLGAAAAHARARIIDELRTQAYLARYRADEARREAVKHDEWAAKIDARAVEMEKKP